MGDIPLVDEKNNLLGYMNKMKVHEKGLLHRAFSLFVFDYKKRLILQKRANDKYHCPGLWSNTACSHPESNIIEIEEIEKRLDEEMGMGCENIEHLFDFIYRKKFDNGLIEHELDSVYISFSKDRPNINPLEVSMIQHSPIKRVYEEVGDKPWRYTYWFKEILNDDRFKKGLKEFGLL